MQVMALNIGAALWLAASGEGVLRCRPSGPSGTRDAMTYRSEVWMGSTAITAPSTVCFLSGGACDMQSAGG